MSRLSILAVLLLLLSVPARADEAASSADPLLQALLQGEAMLASGDYAGLLGVAEKLRLMGANPIDGQSDVAIRWIGEARAHGVTRAILSPRGRALGPGYRRGSLPGGESMTISQVFLGGQPARVALAPAERGSGEALSIAVKDGAGKLLCGGGAICIWEPAYSGRFDIVIANEGDAASDFFVTIR
ncbi:MAG: hypothetical protein ABW039_06930 [Sphingobium sp.]